MRICQCKEILGIERIYIHLMGCPEQEYSKEWETFSWWKKLWMNSPESIYEYHLNSLYKTNN